MEECCLEINLNDRNLVYNAAGGDLLPFDYVRRSYTFPYTRNANPQALTIRFTCTVLSGEYTEAYTICVGAKLYRR